MGPPWLEWQPGPPRGKVATDNQNPSAHAQAFVLRLKEDK
jgi:hypothetical protein